jgi:hypothetical protein
LKRRSNEGITMHIVKAHILPLLAAATVSGLLLSAAIV